MRWPWYPVALVAAIVIAFWLDSATSPFAVFRSLLVGAAAAGAVTLLLAAPLRNAHLSAAVVAGVVLLVYSKRLVETASAVLSAMDVWVAVLWLAAIVLALLLAARLLLRAAGRRPEWPRLTLRLNQVTILLLLATMVTGLLGGSLGQAAADLRQGSPTLASRSAQAQSAGPDIYLLLLDGYARADVLQERFDYDNRPFLDDLASRGFVTAANSHADYLWTHLTLVSLLHMDYVERIDQLERAVEGHEPPQPAVRRAMNENPVFDALRAAGYTVVATASGFEQVALRQSDVFIDTGQATELELQLLTGTYLGDIIRTFAPDWASAQHRGRVIDSLDAVAQLAGTAGQPLLAFAHVGSPHQPTVFGPGGEDVTTSFDRRFFLDSAVERGDDHDEFVNAYRGQLIHLNRLVLGAVDEILANSATPPLIIIMSDHGSASRVDWTTTRWEDAEPSDQLERAGILFSAYTPGRDNVFPDDVTPANVFRHLFNAYLDVELPLASPPPGGRQLEPPDASH